MPLFVAIRRTLHQLEGSHWPAKLFAVVYVLYRKVKCRLHEPQVDCQAVISRSETRTGYPRGPPLSTSLSRSKPDMRTDAPSLTLPKTFSAQIAFSACYRGKRANQPSGTSQSSKTSSHVSLPRMPTLSSFWCVESPLKSLSTMNVVMPLDPFSGAVFAYTTSVDAMGPFVILVRGNAYSNTTIWKKSFLRTKTCYRSVSNLD